MHGRFLVQDMNNLGRYGFTLVELLVVIAIVALLAALLIPTFGNIWEHTRATACRNNLKEMAQGINSSPGQRPYPPEWYQFLRGRGLGGVLTCPSDPDADSEAEPENFPDLEDVYLVQKQGNSVRFSNIKVILDTGSSPEDNQVTRTHSAHGITAEEGQELIKVGGECAMMRVTYGSIAKFESMIIAASHGCASVHWLCIDDGSPDWRARVEAGLQGASSSEEATPAPDPGIFVMRLQSGPKYTRKWGDFTVGFQKASYAMSDAVANIAPRPGQLMIVEYSKDVAKVLKQGYRTDEFGSSNADQKGFLRTRHFDQANFVTTDGSVRSMTREQLQYEHDEYKTTMPAGLWAP